MSQEYVLVYCVNPNFKNQVLMVLKDRPPVIAGRLDLPGGKIDPGETPEQAARRELREETGYDRITAINQMGVLTVSTMVIHCFWARITDHLAPMPRKGETERPMWMPWETFLDDQRVIPNLRVMVPMMQYGVTGWKISDDANSRGQASHTFNMQITLPG